MANEIRMSLAFNVSNGNYTGTWSGAGALAFTQNAIGDAGGTITTSSSATNIDYNNISTSNVGFILFENLDSSHAADIGQTISSTFYGTARILAGEHCVFRVTPSVQLQVKAVSGTPQLKYWLLQA